MKVQLHWAERFINWYELNTKLYLDPLSIADDKELLEHLKPFFDKLKEEAYREGYRGAVQAFLNSYPTEFSNEEVIKTMKEKLDNDT